MNTEDTVYDSNEKTQFDKTMSSDKQKETQTKEKETPQTKTKGGMWKKVAVSGGVGILFGKQFTQVCLDVSQLVYGIEHLGVAVADLLFVYRYLIVQFRILVFKRLKVGARLRKTASRLLRLCKDRGQRPALGVYQL